MSKVTLYMAISIDGYIAGQNDETPWSHEEWIAFQEFVGNCDVCLLGRRTYEIMRDSGEFVKDAKYIVVTHDKTFDAGEYGKMPIWSKAYLPNVDKIGVIGGGDLNGSFAEMGIIDEIILDIEPIILGKGKRLFGSHDIKPSLELISTKRIGKSTVQNHYKVVG